MKTRTKVGSSIRWENKATKPIKAVQAAVPQTKIDFREKYWPMIGDMRTPMICATPVSDYPTVTAFSFPGNTASKTTPE